MIERNEQGVPTVEIHLDRPRRAMLNLVAIRRIKDAPDMGVDFLKRMENEPLVDHIDGLLWAALAEDSPDLTREQVAGMIHFGNLSHIVERLGALFAPSMPDADPLDSQPEKRKPAKAKGKKAKG